MKNHAAAGDMTGCSHKERRLSPLLSRETHPLIRLLLVFSVSVAVLLPSAHATNSRLSLSQ